MSARHDRRRPPGTDAHRAAAADDQAARRSICARSPIARAGRRIGCWKRCSSTRLREREARRIERHRAESAAEPRQAAVELRLRRGAERVEGPGDGAGRGPRVARSRRQRAAVRPARRRQEPLVCGLGHALIDAGRRVLFTRCGELVQRLQAARRDLRLPQELAKLDRFDLLILDDLSYVRRDQAETSRAVRADRRALRAQEHRHHGQHAVLAMGRGVRRAAMTVAAVDRLVHHSTILEMNVESYRRRAAQAEGAPAARKSR